MFIPIATVTATGTVADLVTAGTVTASTGTVTASAGPATSIGFDEFKYCMTTKASRSILGHAPDNI